MRHWAIAGFGYWGPKVARAMAGLSDITLAVVCDREPDRLAAARQAHPGALCTPDFDALLARTDVEAVWIATPVETHFAMAHAALLADKHVLVEKPLVMSGGEAAMLAEAARAHRRVLRTGHTYLHSTPVGLVQRLLARERLGELHYIHSVRHNLGTVRPTCNVIWDLAAHDASIITAWLGRLPERVRALGWGTLSRNQAEWAHLVWEYAGGLVVTVDVSWAAPEKVRHMSLVGSRAMLVYDDMRDPRIVVYDKGLRLDESSGEVVYWDAGQTEHQTDPVEPLRAQMLYFGELIKGGGRAAGWAQQFDLDVVRLLAASQLSLERGGEVVKVADTVPAEVVP